jgi:Holliday junction resolvase RusA-like endonuclease
MEVKIKPISVNVCWRGGRRFKTNEYKAWRETFGYLSLRQTKFKNVTKLYVQFFISNFNRSDLDNMLKPLLDALQECGFIENDNQIKEIHAIKLKCKKGEEKINFELK